MKLTFRINYRTHWGESIYLSGDIAELGRGNEQNAVPMTLTEGDVWETSVDAKELPDTFGYRYIVKSENHEWRHEWGEPHLFTKGTGINRYLLCDHWQDMPSDKPYYSSAFIDGMLNRTCRDEALVPKKGYLTISVDAPMVQPDETVCISGECEVLGVWNPAHALRMNDARFPVWEVNIPVASLPTQFEYKFLIVKTATGEVVRWEGSGNHVCRLPKMTKTEAVCMSGHRFADFFADWKCAGTAIPVFSVKTEEDFGVGDFVDLKKMIDWCVATGQKILQILPINDTTKDYKWTDSYPYSAISTFALHPLYMRLEAMGTLKDAKRRAFFKDEAKRLNAFAQVDYEQVMAGKMAYIGELFAQDGARIMKSKAFKDFMKRNADWLKPYAAFCVLRDLNGTPEMSKWGEFASYTPDTPDRVYAVHKEAMDMVYYIQYHLDTQMRGVREYAHLNGVVLKGDIPIGIDRYSVDAWVYPELFNMDSQAGAPPDDFSVLGQNWGFPTYNWDAMSQDGFAWWKARFRKMSEYFDAYRIDHVLGFFRIWQIPLDAVHGLLGVFNPALPFSPEEMRSSYDFWINADIQTHPYIMDWMLNDFFGEHTDKVKSLYLNQVSEGRYALKPEFDTQTKVVAYFAEREKSEENERICNALLGLIDDVLFIEDPYRKGHYHPRISAQFTYQYRALNDYERWCFDRLYNDFFYRRHNDFWYGKAMWKLPPLIDSTKMLTCAEDLGMIPSCVPDVMSRLQILSLEIQRMPKDPHDEFGNTWAYPYYSVCTTSTHDMSGIRGWWEEDRAKTQDYYNKVLHEPGDAPYFAEPWVCSKIVKLQLDSPSMLCILPWQDWMSTDGELRRENPADEQINIPAISRHYWRYRMHMTVEQLMKETGFNASLRDMITHSGR